LKIYEVIFEIDKKDQEIKGLEQETLNPGFWDARDRAQKIMREINFRKSSVEQWQALNAKTIYIDELLELTEAKEV